MPTKNNIFLLFIFILNSLLMNTTLHAAELDIVAQEITIDKKNNTLTGTGSVIVTDASGTTIKADKVRYEKSNEFLTAIGSVEIKDANNNILTSDKMT